MMDLIKELSVVKGGGLIALPPGNYGDVKLAAKFDERVVIKSEDKANPAVFRSLSVVSSAGLQFEDLSVDWKPTETTLSHENAVSVRASQRVKLVGCKIKGHPAITGIAEDTPVDAPRHPSGNILGLPTGRGVYFEGSKGVALEDSNVSGFQRGVVAYKTDGMELLRNDIHHNRGSTFSANGLSRALFAENHFHSSNPWNYGGKGDHGDFIAIQFASGQTLTNADIQILNNLFDVGDGKPIMGILISDQPGTERLLIDGNLFLGGHTQAMLLNQILSGAIDRNRTMRIGGEAKTTPGLLSRDVPARFTMKGNILGSAVIGPGTKNVPAENGNIYNQTEATPAEIEAARKAWLAMFRPAPVAPVEPEPAIRVIQVKAGERIIIEGV